MSGPFVSFLCCPPARLLSTEAQNYEFRVQEFSLVHTKLYPQHKLLLHVLILALGIQFALHPILVSDLELEYHFCEMSRHIRRFIR